MKKVLFVITALNTGGAEKSLVNLLNLFDYSRYSVDLLLFKKEGSFLKQVPNEVNILEIPDGLKYLYNGFDRNAIGNWRAINSGVRRYFGTAFRKIKYSNSFNRGTQIRWNLFYKKAIDVLPGEYDVAISYMHGEAMYYVAEKVITKKKITWVHNDYTATRFDKMLDAPYFNKFDSIVSISDECVHIWEDNFPQLRGRAICIPNLTSSELTRKIAKDYVPEEYCTFKKKNPDAKILLSIGRLNYQKGFDYVVDTAKQMKEAGVNFIWYILGQGELKDVLDQAIKEAGVEEQLVLLGIRENPYPYIYNCDIVVQPSRFEGKSVVLDEAKILCKPIVVSDYNTVKDQIIADKEGIIVKLDSNEFARAIRSLMYDAEKQNELIEYLSRHEYGNADLISRYYMLIDNIKE